MSSPPMISPRPSPPRLSGLPTETLFQIARSLPLPTVTSLLRTSRFFCKTFYDEIYRLAATSPDSHVYLYKLVMLSHDNMNGLRLFVENCAAKAILTKLLGDDDGVKYDSALQAAVGEDREAVVRLLLDAGADIDAPGGRHYGGTALELAIIKGHGAIVRLLLERGANSENGLHTAAYGNHEALVRLFLDRGADINAVNPQYISTALQLAAIHGDEATIRLLLDRGADVNVWGGAYGTPLERTASGGKEAVVRLLLERGADVNATHVEYGGALQAAARFGHEAVVRLLLDHGADINARGGQFGSPLQAATASGHMGVVQLLLARGAENTRAFHSAVHSGNAALVRQFLEFGADVDAPHLVYGTPLQVVAWRGNEEVIRVLLEYGADVHAPGGLHGTALEAAAKGGHNELVQLLLNHGAAKIEPSASQ